MLSIFKTKGKISKLGIKSFTNTSASIDNQSLIKKTITVLRKGPIGCIVITRPHQHNSINSDVEFELIDTLKQFDNDKSVKCIIITGSGTKAFSAGADIREMATLSHVDINANNMFSKWQEFKMIKIPIIAAVNGIAYGGGCELAMMCDIVIASDNAVFSQPEITLGTIPGMGGTQRLTRTIGKSKAMEMILTGCQINAHTAERLGLVSKVVPFEDLMVETEMIANKIASMSRPITMLAKASVDEAFETTLGDGLDFEKTAFKLTFAMEDRIEGIAAFLEKRKPVWYGE